MRTAFQHMHCEPHEQALYAVEDARREIFSAFNYVCGVDAMTPLAEWEKARKHLQGGRSAIDRALADVEAASARRRGGHT